VIQEEGASKGKEEESGGVQVELSSVFLRLFGSALDLKYIEGFESLRTFSK